MNDILPSVPKPVVASSRTTQEWILDKPALAHWLQHTFESTQLAYGINKHEIEPDFCRYTMDYEKMATLSEHIVETLANKGLLKGLDRVAVTGSGKHTGLAIDVDLDALFNAQHSKRLEVLGTPQPAEPMSAEKAAELIKQSFSLNDNGATLDGEKLLRGLKGLADLHNAANEAVTKEYNAIHPFEKNKMFQPFVDKLREIGNDMGYDFTLEGSKLKAHMQYDRVLAYMERHAGPDRGFTIQRNGNGTADLTVDYARMIDLASEQAHLFVANHSKDGKSEIMHDTDSIKITLSTGGLNGLWNALVQKISESMIEGAAKYQGTIRDNLGTVAQLPKRS